MDACAEAATPTVIQLLKVTESLGGFAKLSFGSPHMLSTASWGWLGPELAGSLGSGLGPGLAGSPGSGLGPGLAASPGSGQADVLLPFLSSR